MKKIIRFVMEKISYYNKMSQFSREKEEQKQLELKNEKAINAVVFNDKVYVRISGDAVFDIGEFNLDPAKVVSSIRKSRLEWVKHNEVK